jgi:hypothetical protein
MFKRLLLVFSMVLAGIGTVAAPAQADPQSTLPSCEFNWASWGSAGYSATFSGVEIGVNVTVGWQYVGSTVCNDINIAPDSGAGYYWNSGIEKVRTYMCNSSGSCWYNAWRNCQGGCTAATAMASGTKYQVHMASYSGTGWYAKLYD